MTYVAKMCSFQDAGVIASGWKQISSSQKDARSLRAQPRSMSAGAERGLKRQASARRRDRMFCVSVSGSCRTDGGASRQRIVRAVVQATDSVAVESRLIHFESSAKQKAGSTLFDGKATSEHGLRKPFVTRRLSATLASYEKQFASAAVIE